MSFPSSRCRLKGVISVHTVEVKRASVLKGEEFFIFPGGSWFQPSRGGVVHDAVFSGLGAERVGS